MTRNHFEPIEELWKHGGFVWQILYDGERYDVSTKPLCTNCFYELGNNSKCDDCGKQHKQVPNIAEAATKAVKSLNAAKRRKSYTVTAPQVGEKIADLDLDLPNERFMNVKLEDRKGKEQVVITAGKKGDKDKAQIFIDLSKNEIRHDDSNANPKEIVESVELDSRGQNIKKQFVAPNKSIIKIELLKGDDEGWANWSGKNGVQSGFRYNIRIDNFGGQVDFVNDINITTKDGAGNPWSTTYYAFDDHRPNEKLKIDQDEIKDIAVQLTDQPQQNQRHMPDIDIDIVQLNITMRRDGRLISIPIPAGRLRHQ